MKQKDLTFVALYLALFLVLDYLSAQIPFLQMPQGGSIGLGVIVLCIASYHLGIKLGVLTGVLSVILQAMVSQFFTSPDFALLDFILEYVCAYGVYGLSSLFPNYKQFYTGVLVTNFIRFALHTVCGVYFWSVTWAGSIAYNLPYMAATCAVAMLVIPVIWPRLKKIVK
ncbi:MAG: energy-coupled thiamine transporter ThiT [Erysipelotrichaceae bacterium]|jgi:thiamine transporter|nr:energy-coupled thiamine transporter ThiT [Erysipelotrichaceae bacterium]